MPYEHLAAVERGTEPLTRTDAIALARTLACPADWLRSGWAD
jgi:hypothetical protein